MKTNRNPKMKYDFFTNLPTEIMLDIVVKLPIQSIKSCERVCKSWRDLIKTREFVGSHFSRSRPVPCLALYTTIFPKAYKIIEFVDTQSSGQNRCCNTIFNFSFPHKAIIYSSANGLLFLLNDNARDLFICNPITHEYIKLPSPVALSVIDVLGFGASKLSGDYKIVRLFSDRQSRQLNPPRKCAVFSLRRGSWRSVETAGDQLQDAQRMSLAVFSNGNLHWLVGVYSELHQSRGILCFDLETECFSTFSIPYLDVDHRSMCASGDCLCLYDSSRDGFVIWLMKKYGDDKSWTKEFVIEIRGLSYHRDVVPIKVFSKDGDILFVHHYIFKLYYYSSKTRTVQVIGAAEFIRLGTRPHIYTPSFVPLKTLTMENTVISF